jgi:hypothetical protein
MGDRWEHLVEDIQAARQLDVDASGDEVFHHVVRFII